MKLIIRNRVAGLAISSILFVAGLCGQEAAVPAWRCSLDGHAYRIQTAGSVLQIDAVESGALHANLQIKAGKNGKTTIVGQWQAGNNFGFLHVNNVTEQAIYGYMLIAQPGAPLDACVSRTSALLTAFASQGGRTPCGVVQVSWTRQEESIDEAISRERAGESSVQVEAQQQTPAAIGQAEAGSSLIGTWVYEDAGAVHYTHIEITLAADGTYSKTIRFRTPGTWGGGGVIGATGLGGTHQGRWTSEGMTVHLSGDGNWPASTHNLASFQRVQ